LAEQFKAIKWTGLSLSPESDWPLA